MVHSHRLTHSNQIIKIKIKGNSSGLDNRCRRNQRKTHNETSGHSKIKTSSKTKAENDSENRNSRNEIDNNRLHSNNWSSKSAYNKIVVGSRNRIASNRLHNNNSAYNRTETGSRNEIDSRPLSNSNNGQSSNASNKIATDGEIKTGSNSARNNNEYKMTNSAGRGKSGNGTSTCVPVQIRSRGMFGSSVGHALGILSTEAGSSEGATVGIASQTNDTGVPLVGVITSEFTASR